MDQWWNDTDRTKLKHWKKKNYRASVVGERVSMEHWWNDTDRTKLKYWEEISVPVTFLEPQIPHGLAWDINNS
jgi:hypothetical protein